MLSVNGSNLEVARDLAGEATRVVVIPDFGEGLDTLDRNIEALERWGVAYLIDPVIEPIGFGFMASLERYAEVHRRYPEARQMMGIGNITELTSADSTGVNALLIAICEEVGVRRGAHHRGDPLGPRRGARDRHRPPADAPRGAAADPAQGRGRPAADGEGPEDPGVQRGGAPRAARGGQGSELPDLHRPGHDHRLQRRDLRPGTDIQEIFSQLGVEEGTHAFYLGRELMKARLAITLGKTYRQEGALAWGYLTPPDDVRSEHVKLTQRKRGRRSEGE